MKKTKSKNTQIFKHLFIPHQKNGFRPHAFRHRMLTLYSFALLTTQVLMGVTYFSGTSLAAETSVMMKQNIVSLTNSERTANRLGILQENSTLNKAAQDKLADMFANNYWDHTSPTGVEPWHFFNINHYEYSFAGENLAKGFVDSSSVIKAWMASPSHKKNILKSDYQEIGVAVGEGKLGGKPTILIVQLFGAKKQSTVAAAKTEQTANKVEGQPTFSRENITIANRLPFFLMFTILFALIIFDGVMLRKTGYHKSKKHLFQFRVALLVNFLVLMLLALNYVSIA
jgi:hypothetical protein